MSKIRIIDDPFIMKGLCIGIVKQAITDLVHYAKKCEYWREKLGSGVSYTYEVNRYRENTRELRLLYKFFNEDNEYLAALNMNGEAVWEALMQRPEIKKSVINNIGRQFL